MTCSIKPQVGEEVEVTYRGRVTRHSIVSGDGFYVKPDDGIQSFHTPAEYTSVRVIEPTYTTGQVYKDSKGSLYLRQDSRVAPWYSLSLKTSFCEDAPRKPMTLMVPEKKLDTSAYRTYEPYQYNWKDYHGNS